MVNSLVGKQLRISVEPKTKDDKTYDLITDFYKAETQLSPLTPEEKENSRVKKDSEQPVDNSSYEVTNEDINVSNVPF